MQPVPTRESPPTFRDKHLIVDLREQLVILDGENVRLTPIQYRLFSLLVDHAGVVVTRPVLLM
jgi:two-component system KDP operon response regulator KdpE